ncbi:MAG TPA: hypothetical protein VMZ00_13185, partial [Sporichthya sp.]|nr:hypothetical protein [Sporichthya sp.]
GLALGGPLVAPGLSALLEQRPVIRPARRGRVLGVPGAALATVLALGACDGGSHSNPDATGARATFAAVPDEPETATTAGPLTGRQMPAAEVLGAGWTERADPGSADEGQTDPQAPSTMSRDVDELMDGLVPIGCPDAAVNIALPRPQFALERTFAGPAQQPGVALVLQYGDAAGPARFLDSLERQIRACPAAGSDPNGPLTLGFRGLARTPERVSALRQEQGVDADPNKYLVIAVRNGDRVGLVYLSGIPTSKAAAIGAHLIKSIHNA